MSACKYDVLLYAEHGLYTPALEPKHQMHDRMCVMNKGTFIRLSYNTNDGTDTKWNQYGGTGIILNKDMRARKAKDGFSGDPTKLGRWTWKDLWESWHHYRIHISLPSLSQPKWNAYSMESTSTLLQRPRRY